MNLILFDIDGTLTNTLNLDDSLYRQALAEIHNIEVSDCDWEDYKKFTGGSDSGMTYKIFSEKLGRAPSRAEYEDLKNQFLYSLQSVAESNPKAFIEITGAKALLDYIAEQQDYRIGIATGSWQKSGEIKLKCLDIDYYGMPFGNAEFYHKRQEIVQSAINQARIIYDAYRFDNIIYVGDGVWDLKTANDLEIDFIGVDFAESGVLGKQGTKYVIKDFTDIALFAELLNKLSEPA